MALTITSDPIIPQTDAESILGMSGATTPILVVNTVSAKFLRYTGRTYITQQESDVAEIHDGDDTDTIWLRAHADAVTSVEFLLDGTAYETIASSDLSLISVPSASKVVLHDWTTPREQPGQVRVNYTPGWATVPGDIVAAAVEQMYREKDRMAGHQIGAQSETAGTRTIAYEIDGLLRSVRDAWRPYRIMR